MNGIFIVACTTKIMYEILECLMVVHPCLHNHGTYTKRSCDSGAQTRQDVTLARYSVVSHHDCICKPLGRRPSESTPDLLQITMPGIPRVGQNCT